jgi:hypothetical protein
MDIAAPVKQYNKLRERINPNIEELETFIKATENNNDSQNIKALRLKYQAMTTVPTTIEKTMSPYQLYTSNSPLWAIKLDALSIESFLDIEKNKGKLSKTMFNRIYEYQTQGQYCFDIETGDSITISKKGF